MRLLFLTGGQSNNCDRAQLAELPDFPHRDRIFIYARPQPVGTSAEIGVHGTWQSALDTSVVDPAGAAGGQVGGMLLSFANRLAELRPSDEIGLVPRSGPGTDLYSWRKLNRNNSLYGMWIERGWWALDDSPVPAQIAGIVWWQGEADTDDSASANAWSERFSRLVSDARSDLQNLSLPMVFVRLGEEGLPYYTYWGTLRTQQNLMTMRNLRRVDIDDLPSLSDHVHYPTNSYVQIGPRIADAMQAMLP